MSQKTKEKTIELRMQNIPIGQFIVPIGISEYRVAVPEFQVSSIQIIEGSSFGSLKAPTRRVFYLVFTANGMKNSSGVMPIQIFEFAGVEEPESKQFNPSKRC